MDDRKPQDKKNPKLNPDERNQSEQKHAGSQDRMDAAKKAGQQDNQQNQRNPQQKH
jgi:hypothetical protein